MVEVAKNLDAPIKGKSFRFRKVSLNSLHISIVFIRDGKLINNYYDMMKP